MTLCVAQLAPPVNVPIAITVEAGNINDQAHLRRTYEQTWRVLNDSSLVVFDKGAIDETNLENIVLDRNDYLTSKKLKASDDAIFQAFSPEDWECIDDGVLAVKKTFARRVNYYYFPEKLKNENFASRRRKVERLLAEARSIQDSLDEASGCRSRSASTTRSSM